jgi:hypothetical protein
MTRHSFIHSCICSFIMWFVLRQVHRFFQRQFSTDCHLVLPLSVFSILFSLRSSRSCLRLLRRLNVISILPSIFQSIMCFTRQMWPIQLASLRFILHTTFLSFFTLCNALSFLTRSVQTIFSVLLQHHILKLSRFFWSTFRRFRVSVPKVVSQNFQILSL